MGKRGPKKGTKPKRDRLSKKAKKEIIRDVMKRHVNYNRHGFTTVLRQYFINEYGITLTAGYIWQLKKEVIDDLRNADDIFLAKRHILESMARLCEKAEEAQDIAVAGKLLTEIADLQGMYLKRDEGGHGDLAEIGRTLTAIFKQRTSDESYRPTAPAGPPTGVRPPKDDSQ